MTEKTNGLGNKAKLSTTAGGSGPGAPEGAAPAGSRGGAEAGRSQGGGAEERERVAEALDGALKNAREWLADEIGRQIAARGVAVLKDGCQRLVFLPDDGGNFSWFSGFPDGPAAALEDLIEEFGSARLQGLIAGVTP